MSINVRKDYIIKGQTEDAAFGSFDAYRDKFYAMMQRKHNLSVKESDEVLKKVIHNYRAAIVKDGEFIGVVGVYNFNLLKRTGSVFYDLENPDPDFENSEIFKKYLEYLDESVGFNIIEEKSDSIMAVTTAVPKKSIEFPHIITPTGLVVKPASQDLTKQYKEEKLVPRNIRQAYSIEDKSGKNIGLIGLSNLFDANQRGDLKIVLGKDIDPKEIKKLDSSMVESYVGHMRNLGVRNILFNANASNVDLWTMVRKAGFAYAGEIPFAAKNGNTMESSLCFQNDVTEWAGKPLFHTKDMVDISTFSPFDDGKTPKERFKKIIELPELEKCKGKKFKMVSSSVFAENGIDFNEVLDGFMSAMSNRIHFTIPLGDDKLIASRGNENCGLYASLKGYTYVVLDENNKFSGFISILRENAEGYSLELESAIIPELQGKGLGTEVLKAFCGEAYDKGAASLVVSIFEGNDFSEKTVKNNGFTRRYVRGGSIYYGGALHNIYVSSKTNPKISA